MRLTITAWLDRIGGALLGAVFGGVVVSCLLIVVLALPIDRDFKQDLRDDEVSARLLHLAPSVYDAVCGLWNGESFSRLVDQHIEPAARNAAESIRAVVEDLDRETPDQ